MLVSYIAHLPLYFALWLFRVYAQIDAQIKVHVEMGLLL